MLHINVSAVNDKDLLLLLLQKQWILD